MKYAEVIRYMESKKSLGIVPGLDSIRKLCKELGNPQDELKFIHIVGTNGKGSIGNYIATMLQYGGYQVGAYHSPAVIDYGEIIKVNGRKITQKDIGIFFEKIKMACEKMEKNGEVHPTNFEMETALAFLYFKEMKCDIVVLEAGMGGKLDATNCILAPLVAIIASISKDHTQFLGNTLAEITLQKAGIIKAGSIVVSSPQVEEVREILIKESKKKEVEYIQIDKKNASKIKYLMSKTKFCYKNKQELEIPLLGAHQVENCLVALEVIQQLEKYEIKIEDNIIKKALINVKWVGRLQQISKRPYFFVDGAHNVDGMKRLRESIDLYFNDKKVICILGILRDKECDKMLEELVPRVDMLITIKPPNNIWAMESLELAQKIRELTTQVTVADSVEEAIEISYLLAQKQDIILACGSLTYIKNCIKSVESRYKL